MAEGLDGFKALAKNQTYGTDELLSRVSFMNPLDVQTFASGLIKQGFQDAVGGAWTDFAVIDQQRGLTLPCPWLDWARNDDGRVLAWLKGHPVGEAATFPKWSSADQLQFFPDESELELIGTKDNLLVYRNCKTGQVLYTAKPDQVRVAAENHVLTVRDKSGGPLRRWVMKLFNKSGRT
jgi:hypothetical protein